jgi:hypothetical protein
MTIVTNTSRPGDTPEQIAARTAPRNADSVNHPKHYLSKTGLEVIDVIEGFALGFHEGNVAKYLLRWRQKGGVEDLRKARWYLDRLIEKEVSNGQDKT